MFQSVVGYAHVRDRQFGLSAESEDAMVRFGTPLYSPKRFCRAPCEDAPTVSASNQDGENVTLSFDEPTVLYFYPRDETPGCTIEANQFQRELGTYRDAGVAVYGVSTDDVGSHQSFCEAEGLEFDLLADPDGEVAESFDVDVRSGAAERVTYVLADSEVQAVYEDVDPDGHAREVLQDALEAGLVSLSE